MPRWPRKSSEPDRGLAETPEPATASVVASSEARAPRLGFSVTPNGAIDLEAMRPETRQRVLDAIARTAVPGTRAVADDPEWLPIADQIAMLLGVGAAAIAERALGYSHEQALTLLYTPDERAAIAGPASRVLRKRFGMLAESEETLLALAIIGVTLPKIASLKRPATLHEMPRQAAAGANQS
jgi:hypothetical protein